MGNAIAFYVISALILGFALLVVTTKNTVHAVLFLVLNFLAVAALYVLLTAQFLAVDSGARLCRRHRRALPVRRDARESEAAAGRSLGAAARGRGWGSRSSAAVLAQLAPFSSGAAPGRRSIRRRCRTPTLRINNVERIGMLLYTDYLIPFEVASMLLLVAMVGAIILAKREL